MMTAKPGKMGKHDGFHGKPSLGSGETIIEAHARVLSFHGEIDEKITKYSKFS